MRLKLGFSDRIGFFFGVFIYICGMNDSPNNGNYSQGKQDTWEFGQAGYMGISARTVLPTYDTLLPSTLYEVILVCSYPLPVLRMV
jgi:hypothetical protein